MKIIRKVLYPITIICLIVIIFAIVNLKHKLNNEKYNDIKQNDEILFKEELTEAKEQKEEQCKVDIKGAIKKPNVYSIECSYTINDVIEIAGGLNDNADTSVINLAKQVENEMVIIIYTKEEVKNSNIVDTVIKVVEKECICPNIQNDGCINDKITDKIGDNSNNGNNNSNSNNELININNATLEELQNLSGIGESKAKAIIKYREEKGNFKTIEEILNVDGIGNSVYEQIKIHITT